MAFNDGFDTTEEAADPQANAGVNAKRKGRAKANLSKGLSGSGRALVMVFSIIILAVIGGVAAVSMLRGSGMHAQARIMNQAPDSSQAPTGVKSDPRYQRLIKKSNQSAEKQALNTGGSFIPTLVGAPPAAPAQSAKAAHTCGAACLETKIQKLKREQAATHNQMENIKIQNQQLRQQMAGYQQQGAQHGIKVNWYMYQGHVYESKSYEQKRLAAYQKEMAAVSKSLTGYQGQSFASTISFGHTGASSSGNSSGQAQAGSGTSSAPGKGSNGSGASGSTANTQSGRTLVSAAKMIYATLDMTADSDVPGPIRATIQAGPLAGSHVLGKFTVKNAYLVMDFTSLTTPKGVTYPIDAIGVNPETRMIGLSDSVDYHTLAKLAAIFGAAFLQGFGNAMLASGTVTTTGLATTTVSNLNTQQAALAALGQVGQAASQLLKPYAEQPPTVIKYADTGLVLLFLKPLKAS